MTRLSAAARAVGRWAADWRTGAVVCATAFVALLMVIVVTSSQTTRDALDTRDSSAAAATRRIDLLNDRIEELSSQTAENGEVIGALRSDIKALQEQVFQLGGTPVVPTTTTTTRRQAPTSSTTTRPTTSTTSTTSTTRPPSTTTTTRPCRLNVAGRCIGGRP